MVINNNNIIIIIIIINIITITVIKNTFIIHKYNYKYTKHV